MHIPNAAYVTIFAPIARAAFTNAESRAAADRATATLAYLNSGKTITAPQELGLVTDLTMIGEDMIESYTQNRDDAVLLNIVGGELCFYEILAHLRTSVAILRNTASDIRQSF